MAGADDTSPDPVWARGSHVVVRRMTAADHDAFVGYRTDAELGRFQSWGRQSADDHAALLSEMARVETPLRPGLWTQAAICLLPGSAIAGDLGLFLSEDGRTAELGITLARHAQGKGLAQEAVRLAESLIWALPSVDRINIWADSRNTGSIRLFQRLGYIDLGETTEFGHPERAFKLDRPGGR